MGARDGYVGMIAPHKVHLLQSFLGGLPPQMATRLAQAVEVDRLSDGTALPHDLILDGLRPVLRRAEPRRTLTPTRIFCRPIEDLLVAGARKQKLTARISRDAIAPVWEWLEQTLAPDALRRYADGVKEAVFSGQIEAAMSIAGEFWPVASAAILDALSSDEARKSARHILGSELIVADAVEMAKLLAVGPEILEVQGVLPKPVPALGDELLWQLRDIYERVVAKAADAAPFVAVIAMNRLERPWEALKLPLLASRQTRDTLISSTDMGLVGEIIFGEIEDHLTAIHGARSAQFDGDALAGEVAAFAELSMGIVKGVEMRRDGKWGQRLMKARAAVAEAMEGYMERAPREILAALPTRRGGYKGGPRMPDIAQAPDPDKRARALSYARLIAGCRPFAVAASFASALKDASDELVAALGLYNDEVLRELRAAEGDKRAHAEAYLNLAADLTASIMSQQEGELLRRRGRAALASQAA